MSYRVNRLCVSVLCLGCLIGVSRADDAPRKDEKKPLSCTPTIKNPDRHEQFLKRIQEGKIGLLFEGDSITDGWRSSGKEVYQKYYSKYDPANFGIGGDRTEHVLWRMQNGELDGIDPKVVVMMIGTNNTGRDSVEDIAAGVTCLVDEIHTKLPKTKVLLLGIFPRSPSPTEPVRAKIAKVNDIISKLGDRKYVTYLDIGEKFLDKDGHLPGDVMPDALHPNAKGYEIWAEAMQPTLDKLME